MIDFNDYIEIAENFPKEGISYKDIQPLLEDNTAFSSAIQAMGDMIDHTHVDYFVGIDARGFIFATALSMKFGGGIKLIRKSGKLPDINQALCGIEYDLEYGTDRIEMKPGTGNIVIVDDIYATGGTMDAAEKLCIQSGYNILDKLCLLDIGIRPEHDVKCLII